MPDKLVGYLNNQGYQLAATDVYSLSSQDLQGNELHNHNSNKDVSLDNPHGMLLFFNKENIYLNRVNQ